MSSPDASPDIETLFAQTLLGDYDDDAPWEAVHTLRKIGTREVLDRAMKWLHSPDPSERARGADILAQLGDGSDREKFAKESFHLIVGLLQRETTSLPISSAIHALGQLGDPSAIDLIVGYTENSDEDIRFSAACSLGKFAADQRSVDSLIKLMRDDDGDVRDWATFGLGACTEVDSPQIREALLERLEDSFFDARLEAIEGLAKRGDQRVLEALLAELDKVETSEFHAPCPIIEAASQMLGLEEKNETWEEADYASALRKRYSI
jgi:HEAT repeat protein